MSNVYQIKMANQTTAYITADGEVDTYRVWTMAFSLGLGEIIDVIKLGPVLLSMGDLYLLPSLDFADILKQVRD